MEQSEVIEGTGEELAAYLKQHPEERFRLTSLTSEQTSSQQNAASEGEASLAELLAGRVGRFHFGDANLSQDSGKKFTALLTDRKRNPRI